MNNPKFAERFLTNYSKLEGWQSLVDCTGLENRQGETLRGFESLPLRNSIFNNKKGAVNEEITKHINDLNFFNWL